MTGETLHPGDAARITDGDAIAIATSAWLVLVFDIETGERTARASSDALPGDTELVALRSTPAGLVTLIEP